ncbi:hypothetical protein IW147_003051 [Coemansia sp. RSA 720]|nr:hypothetical protein IW147_003051 [Coemansia sp. RSA 720]KAJ2545276.1 hypothetical protein GGF49_000510 [Coemansia sp. RSA 1853]
MVELDVHINQGSSQCLVYKNHGSQVEGKVVLQSTDKLKVRQISIRLISTELVDFHNKNASAPSTSAGLHSYLQKSSKTVGTWMILEKKPSAHVLAAGKHNYSFEIPLPKGLDGSIQSKTYSLQYELETRLEYSFKLKPDLTTLMPLTLVQVPMASNLQSDDRISLKVIPGRVPANRERMTVSDVPLGRALCLEADVITQKESFVLHHLWEDVLSLRLRLPFGRVLPVEESPVLDIEAVPLARNHRCTAFKIVLEEISIIARPQRAGLLNTRPRVASTDSGLHPSDGQAPVRRSSVTLSQMSSSSEDSLPVSSHNAWAYAQECSSAYDNAITRVRELSSASAKWPQGQFTTLGAYHGILANKFNLYIPPVTRDDTHTDVRNSHIQVHHQLVYELEYQVVGSEMVDLLQKEPRVRAAAHIYNNLGSANIVCRDEIRDDRRPGPTYTVRGTLPVAVVPAKIANMWGIRNTSRDPQTEPSAVATAISECAASFEPASAPYSSLSMPRLSMPDHGVRRKSTDSHLQSGASTPLAPYPQMPGGFAGGSVFDPSGLGNSGYPPMGFMAQPSSSAPYPPGSSSAPYPPGSSSAPYPPASIPSQYPSGPIPSQYPSGPIPGQYPPTSSSEQYPPQPLIPTILEPHSANSHSDNNSHINNSGHIGDNDHTDNNGNGNDNESGSQVPHSTASNDRLAQPAQVNQQPQAASSDSQIAQPAYNPTDIQRQIEMFQEQQRQQQEQFFKQLSQQYAQMSVGQSGSNVPVLPAALASMLGSGSVPTSPASNQGFASGTNGAEAQASSSNIQPFVAHSMARTNSAVSTTSSHYSDSVSAQPAATEPNTATVVSTLSDIETASAPPEASTTQALEQTNGPPPSYDDLLPPEYEVPSHQPPPYRPLNRSQNERTSRR